MKEWMNESNISNQKNWIFFQFKNSIQIKKNFFKKVTKPNEQKCILSRIVQKEELNMVENKTMNKIILSLIYHLNLCSPCTTRFNQCVYKCRPILFMLAFRKQYILKWVTSDCSLFFIRFVRIQCVSHKY